MQVSSLSISHPLLCFRQHVKAAKFVSLHMPLLHGLLKVYVHGCFALRVKMGEGGMDALITLGSGDMRRTLNILQVSGGGLEGIWLLSH